jgi:DNA/RNA-binding domain of Phe-tRNA-synthetase-like protein
MSYQLTINPQILERYPHYSALILYAEHLTNRPGDNESTALLRQAEQQCRTSLNSASLTQQPHIAAWREAYRSFGAKPKKYPCSLEALLARTLKGQDLPSINLLVDLYNVVSLKHLLPVGGEDWQRLASDLSLTFATGNEPFLAMQEGQECVVYPDPGEVIWVDQEGITCRRWNWRQGLRTQLTLSTQAAYFVLDRLAPYTVEALLEAGEELTQLLKRFCPSCKVSSVLLGEQA